MAVVSSFLQQIESLSLSEEKLAVAASNLTGDQWNGFVYLLSLSEEGFRRVCVNEFSTCLPKVSWLGDRLLLAGDDGVVRVLNSKLRVTEEKADFDYSITDLLVTESKVVVADRAQ